MLNYLLSLKHYLSMKKTIDGENILTLSDFKENQDFFRNVWLSSTSVFGLLPVTHDHTSVCGRVSFKSPYKLIILDMYGRCQANSYIC